MGAFSIFDQIVSSTKIYVARIETYRMTVIDHH